MTTFDATPTSSDDESRAPLATSPPTPHPLRALLLRLHFYAGVFVGPFLLIAAVSGGLYAVAPTIEQVVYRDQLHTDSTGPALPLVEQVRSAQTVLPDLPVVAVRPAVDAGETTRVFFADPTLGESERRAVFVDPVTARPLGDLVAYGSSSALPVRTWISQLHRTLHLGEPGRVYSELAASWLWVIALAGVVLWVGGRRSGARRRRPWTVDPRARGRARTLNWHGVVGLWIAVGLLFLSATGLTWSRFTGAHVDEVRAAMSWTTPTVSKALDSGDGGPAAGGHEGHGMPGGSAEPAGAPADSVAELDRVTSAAREAGVGGHVEVSIPASAGTAFTVAQTRQPWVMSNDTVAVDGATGRITDASWFADWPLAAKLAAWGIQLHMGLLFGLANQLALAALAVALVTVIVRGYLMWWRRRPTRANRVLPVPPRRGAVRGMPLGGVLALGVATVAVGWFIPLLGVSVAAFLAVDVILGVVARQRRSIS